MRKLVLLRHGESAWNKANRFSGWADVDLTEHGIEQAKEAGRVLKSKGFVFEVAFTSVLKRAIRTLWIVLDELDQAWIPVHRSWRLNERHYGALQGLNKAETAAKYGEAQLHIWRRSYDVRPPALEESSEHYPGHDPRYRGLSKQDLPLTESLKDTVDRFLPYWHETIVPTLAVSKCAIISAHGNTLRALAMYLEEWTPEEVSEFNIPTGVPLVYELDDQLSAIQSYYLGDPEAIKRAAKAVANQGKARSP